MTDRSGAVETTPESVAAIGTTEALAATVPERKVQRKNKLQPAIELIDNYLGLIATQEAISGNEVRDLLLDIRLIVTKR